jgi:hypothetical protein
MFRAFPVAVRSALARNDYSAAERACPDGINIGNVVREAARLLG